MYIKLTFQTSSGKVGAESAFATSELVEYPQLVKLPDLKAIREKVEQGAYVRERGVMYEQTISRLAYYLDCSQLPAEQIDKALQLFNKHYHLDQGVMPQVLMVCDDPLQNEIVMNMQAAIHNAGLKLQKRDYQSEYAIQPSEPETTGYCAIL